MKATFFSKWTRILTQAVSHSRADENIPTNGTMNWDNSDNAACHYTLIVNALTEPLNETRLVGQLAGKQHVST